MGLALILIVFLARGWFDWLPISEGATAALTRARLMGRVGMVVALLLLLAAAAPIYYRWRYGAVAPLDRSRRNRWITIAVIAFFAMTRADSALSWPLSLNMLVVSAALLITAWHDGRVRSHYGAAGALWLAVSMIPLLGLPRVGGPWFVVLGGLTLVVCGIGDHVLLTRVLAKPGRSDSGAQAAGV